MFREEDGGEDGALSQIALPSGSLEGAALYKSAFLRNEPTEKMRMWLVVSALGKN
jgi:hypothetical protein